MRIPIKSFVSHMPLFIGGKNFKSDTNIESSAESTFEYDMDEDKLYLFHKGQLRVLNGPTVGYWEPMDYKDVGYDLKRPEKPAPIALGNPGPIKAQVEVPHEKVQNPPTRRSVK